jgi:hypothetical protein
MMRVRFTLCRSLLNPPTAQGVLMTQSPPLASSQFGIWRDHLPEWASQTQALGISLADWVALLALALCSALIGRIGQWFVLHTSAVVSRRTGTTWGDRLIGLLPGLLAALLGLLTFALTVSLLQLPQRPMPGSRS